MQVVTGNLIQAVGDEPQSDHTDVLAKGCDRAPRLHAHANADGSSLEHVSLVLYGLKVRTAEEHVPTRHEAYARVLDEGAGPHVAEPPRVQGRLRVHELAREQGHDLARAKRGKLVDGDDVTVHQVRIQCTCRAGQDQHLDPKLEQKVVLHTHHLPDSRVEGVLVHVDATTQNENPFDLRVWVIRGSHLSNLDATLMTLELIELLEPTDLGQGNRGQSLDLQVITPASPKDHGRVEGVFAAKPKGSANE